MATREFKQTIETVTYAVDASDVDKQPVYLRAQRNDIAGATWTVRIPDEDFALLSIDQQKQMPKAAFIDLPDLGDDLEAVRAGVEALGNAVADFRRDIEAAQLKLLGELNGIPAAAKAKADQNKAK